MESLEKHMLNVGLSAQSLTEWINRLGETKGFGRFTELTPCRSEINAANQVLIFLKLGTQHYHDWLQVATATINAGVMELTVSCADQDWDRGAEDAYKWLIQTMQDNQVIIEFRTSFEPAVMKNPQGQAKAGEANLTRREKEVAECLAEGLSDEEIAKRLCIGSSTVKTHRQNIAKKLGCKEASDVVRLELQRRGYI